MTTHRVLIFIVSLLLAILNSVQVQNIQHVALTQKVQVKINKKSPAYLAFQLVNHQDLSAVRGIGCTQNCENVDLLAMSLATPEINQQAYQIGKMVWISKVSIQRSPTENFPRTMLAENRTRPRQNRFSMSALSSAGISSSEGVNAEGGSRFNIDDLVMDTPSARKTAMSLPGQQSSFGENPLHLQGKIELAGGLAVTDKMNIIVGRQDDGQIQDYGSVDIGAGLYEVKVQKRSGTIVAKLVDENDHLVGEGFYHIQNNNMLNQSLIIAPVKNVASNSGWNYSSKPWFAPGGQTVAQNENSNSTARGENKDSKPDPGLLLAQANIGSGFHEERVPLAAKDKFSYTRSTQLESLGESTNHNSFALLRSAAKDFFQTNRIVSGREKSENILYPQSMIDALRKIVADQRTSDPRLANIAGMKLEDVTVIYGQVLDEEKPSSGVNVLLERFPDITPIYFNALMLPDMNLKTTSANGYFAFLGAPEGMHSLEARRGMSYISHSNVYVETGAVALTELQTTLNIAKSQIVVYDAFTGAPQNMRVSLQSLSNEIEANTEEEGNVLLPAVNRLSLAHTERTHVYYPSTFVYNDNQGSIHLPLIQNAWLDVTTRAIYEKSGQQVNTLYGMIVGFVQDDDYAVEVLGYKSGQKTQVVYFDQLGQVLEQPYGIAGGGFIILNFEDDSAQIKVTGKNSGVSFLQMIPVDPQIASVLSFKLAEISMQGN